jgi:NAD(P)H-hydrate epimerase
MLPVLTQQEMRAIDHATTESLGISSLDLMENAATTVFEFVRGLRGLDETGPITVFCGPGNNGGDGAALARMLVRQGIPTIAVLIGGQRVSEGDAKTNFDRLRAMSDETILTVIDIDDDSVSNIDENALSVDRSMLLVDAIFGTGLSRSPVGGVAKIIETINQRGRIADGRTPCVSIDIPSGLFADSALTSDCHIEADYTVTFTAPKLANVMSPAKTSNGNLLIADIGTPEEILRDCEARLSVIESSDALRWLRATDFTPDSFKNRRGHVLCVTGSVGYEGAAVLSANSAMMSGAGVVTILTPSSACGPIAARVVPEVMVRTFDDTGLGFELLAEHQRKADSILVGCGIGLSEPNRGMLRQLLQLAECPVVVDADALTLLSPFVKSSKLDGPTLILTPHDGEFRRMFGIEAGIGEERIANVRAVSLKHGVMMVLKGQSTLVGFPDGRVAINPTGNSAVGKAGNGDNLAGIIAGFVAQSNARDGDVELAVLAAVYTAGLAADIARERFGERVMLATDVRDALSDAFVQIEAG